MDQIGAQQSIHHSRATNWGSHNSAHVTTGYNRPQEEPSSTNYRQEYSGQCYQTWNSGDDYCDAPKSTEQFTENHSQELEDLGAENISNALQRFFKMLAAHGNKPTHKSRNYLVGLIKQVKDEHELEKLRGLAVDIADYSEEILMEERSDLKFDFKMAFENLIDYLEEKLVTGIYKNPDPHAILAHSALLNEVAGGVDASPNVSNTIKADAGKVIHAQTALGQGPQPQAVLAQAALAQGPPAKDFPAREGNRTLEEIIQRSRKMKKSGEASNAQLKVGLNTGNNLPVFKKFSQAWVGDVNEASEISTRLLHMKSYVVWLDPVQPEHLMIRRLKIVRRNRDKSREESYDWDEEAGIITVPDIDYSFGFYRSTTNNIKLKKWLSRGKVNILPVPVSRRHLEDSSRTLIMRPHVVKNKDGPLPRFTGCKCEFFELYLRKGHLAGRSYYVLKNKALMPGVVGMRDKRICDPRFDPLKDQPKPLKKKSKNRFPGALTPAAAKRVLTEDLTQARLLERASEVKLLVDHVIHQVKQRKMNARMKRAVRHLSVTRRRSIEALCKKRELNDAQRVSLDQVINAQNRELQLLQELGKVQLGPAYYQELRNLNANNNRKRQQTMEASGKAKKSKEAVLYSISEEQLVQMDHLAAVGSGDEEAVGSGDEEAIGSGDEEAVGSGEEEAIGSEDEEAVGSGDEEAVQRMNGDSEVGPSLSYAGNQPGLSDSDDVVDIETI